MSRVRIVAEVSKTWENGPHCLPATDTLASRFERVITKNAERGYDVESWQMQTTYCPETEERKAALVETIIAVFVEREKFGATVTE